MTANNIQDYQMFIDGQWTEAENNQRFESTNPENNKPWSSFPDATVTVSYTHLTLPTKA